MSASNILNGFCDWVAELTRPTPDSDLMSRADLDELSAKGDKAMDYLNKHSPSSDTPKTTSDSGDQASEPQNPSNKG